MSKQPKIPSLPFSGTKIDPYQTQAEITKLIEKYNGEGVQWTTMFRENKVNLKFILKTKDGRKFTIELIPPDIRVSRRTWNTVKGKYEKILVPSWPQSMRLLYWYIEAKLKAITYGLVSAEREWLSDILQQLPDGKTVRVGDFLTDRAVSNQLALEAKVTEIKETDNPQVIVDAELTEESK